MMLNETLEAQREYQRDLQDAYNRGYAKGKEDQAREQHEYKDTAVKVPEKHRLVDADKLMMSLADWWYSSFGEEETDEAKAIRKVLDTVEQSIGAMTVVET